MDMTIFAGRMPAQGETISGTDFLLSPGGKGANQAVAAARMGASTSMYGCVGDDVFGEALLRVLAQCGIDGSGVARCPQVSTGVASITVVGGDNRIILHAGANALVSSESEALDARLASCDAVLMQLEIPPSAVLGIIEKAHAMGKKVFLTPAPAQQLPAAAYKKIDYLIPNETEAGVLLGRELHGDQDMLEALRAFRELGVAHPLITLGERGVGCIVDGEPRIVSGYRVDPIDTTAAGDTFTGALAACIMGGMDWLASIDFAQKAAAICITRQGAQNAVPQREEVLTTQLERAVQQ